MKRYSLIAVCCAWVGLAAGLAYGQTMPRQKYFGKGPEIYPPYWEVPDLTKAYVPSRASAQDITYKTQQEASHTDMVNRRDAGLRGEVVSGRTYQFCRPRTYYDHVTANTNLMATRPNTSVQDLQNGPTISSTASRYNVSLRYWEIARYRSNMQRSMDQSQRRPCQR